MLDCFFFCLFLRIQPGLLHKRAVIRVEQSNGWKTTALIHWQEDFFSLRLQVVKPAPPDESNAGLRVMGYSGKGSRDQQQKGSCSEIFS